MANAKFKVYLITKAGTVARRHQELFRATEQFTAAELLTAALFSRRIDHKTVKIFLETDELQAEVDTSGILENDDDIEAQARAFCRSLNLLAAGYAD